MRTTIALIFLLLLVEPISAIIVIEGPNWGTRQEFGTNLGRKEWKVDLEPGLKTFLVTQKNTPHGTLDFIGVYADKKIIRPKSAKQSTGDVTRKVSANDLDVIDVHEKTVTASFDIPKAKQYKLVMLANEFDDKAAPLRSPRIGFAIARVFEGTMEVDGKLDTDLGIYNNPVWWLLNSRPQGYTYTWWKSDGKYLYVAVEITADNTNFGNERISLILQMPDSGFEKITFDAHNKDYGKQGFQYTKKVNWEHKVFEFKIPYRKKPSEIKYAIEYQLF